MESGKSYRDHTKDAIDSLGQLEGIARALRLSPGEGTAALGAYMMGCCQNVRRHIGEGVGAAGAGDKLRRYTAPYVWMVDMKSSTDNAVSQTALFSNRPAARSYVDKLTDKGWSCNLFEDVPVFNHEDDAI